MNPSYLLVILGVVMVSYSGPLVKGALLAGATPVTVACLRMLLSVPPLFLIACLPRKNGSRPISGLHGLTLRQWRWNLLGSVCLALHYLTWMSSLNATSTFASVALVCTQPLFVAIFSAVLLKERMPKRLAKAYRVEGLAGGTWRTLAEEQENFLRHRVHPFPEMEITALRVTVEATWGDPSARLFEVRVY